MAFRQLHATSGNLEHYRVTRRVPFPHMGPADTRVWRLALSEGLLPETEWTYDVRLGGAGAIVIPDEHTHKAMWETLLRKRVDAYSVVAGRPWLVEVKPIGSFAALGQALGYCDLWEREHGKRPQPLPVVVCAVIDRDLAPTFERYGVRVISLPVALAERCLS